MTSCKWKGGEFYDLKLLSLAQLPIDTLMKKTVDPRKVAMYRTASTIWQGLYDVTPEIVHVFRKDAEDYVSRIRSKSSVYGYLYFVANHSAEWHTAPHFDYLNFPLMNGRTCVLGRMKEMAVGLGSKPNTSEYDATCLYLLYFFALLVNPSLNWITIDYLANGNRYHQFGTRLKGQMKTITKKVWV